MSGFSEETNRRFEEIVENAELIRKQADEKINFIQPFKPGSSSIKTIGWDQDRNLLTIDTPAAKILLEKNKVVRYVSDTIGFSISIFEKEPSTHPETPYLSLSPLVSGYNAKEVLTEMENITQSALEALATLDDAEAPSPEELYGLFFEQTLTVHDLSRFGNWAEGPNPIDSFNFKFTSTKDSFTIKTSDQTIIMTKVGDQMSTVYLDSSGGELILNGTKKSCNGVNGASMAGFKNILNAAERRLKHAGRNELV